MKKLLSYKLFSLIFLSVFVIGCTKQAPITNRSQLITMSESKEKALGEKSYKEILQKSKLSSNKTQVQRVREIGRKIAATTNRNDYNWEFNLVENKAKNAFALPGGKVVVYTGILDVAQNDSQLATVISHEIAHALARHGAERVSMNNVSNILAGFGSIILSATAPEYSNTFNKAVSIGSKYVVMLPYGRLQENEADEIGIHLMQVAGYDVNEALRFWENMRKVSKQNKNSFFSTHPSSNERIRNIKSIIKSLN